MREIPILFSAPMVRAILAGTKTQTRRILKPQPDFIGGRGDPEDLSCWGWEDPDTCDFVVLKKDPADSRSVQMRFRWAAGDRLWVKETAAVHYQSWNRTDGHWHQVTYAADHDGNGHYIAMHPCGGGIRKGEAPSVFPKMSYNINGSLRWHPSIFMPRWASRITLEVIAVRVERLQAISEADAVAEGAPCGGFDDDGKFYEGAGTYRSGYAGLWDHINGDGSWDANPFVVVIEFRRIAQEAPK